MDSATLMARCEHALRTGQTQNLFPVLANRALQEIHRDRLRAEAELAAKLQAHWFRTHPDVLDRVIHAYAEACKPVADAIRSIWDSLAEAMRPAVDIVLELVQNMPTQADFELAPRRPQGYAPLGNPGPSIPHYSPMGYFQPADIRSNQ